MEHHWFKNIIVYTIDVKSFCDSNGDGTGDFKGLISKLDYINDLGVTCIWLLPFYPSPLRDNGYEVIDHYNVDPRLGSINDFIEFVRIASEMGIQVMIDLVMNHTSDEHPWFLAARNNQKSLFREYYVWAEVPPPQDPTDRPAFPGTEHGVWHFDEAGNSYYYHKFYRFQPDLKISNPQVRDEIYKIMDYWLSLGVAGFRIDAAPVMIKKKGIESSRPLNPQDIFGDMRKFVRSKKKGAILAGEVDVDGHELIEYFSEGAGLNLVFNFLISAYLIGAIAQGKAETLVRGWRELPVIPDAGNWLNFLRNLDELNIYQLPHPERERIFDLLAPLHEARIYQRGIRRRLAPLLEGNQARIEMAYSLLFSLPGTPMITYGDEIGMGDNLDLFERESVRTPMQWTSGANAGFSDALPEKLYRSLVTDDTYSPQKINVIDQMNDGQSLLSHMKEIILARKLHPEIGFGKLAWVATNHPGVIGHICHWKNDMLLTVHNLTGDAVEVILDLKTVYAKRLAYVLGNCEFEAIENGNYRLKLKRYDYVWFNVYYAKE